MAELAKPKRRPRRSKAELAEAAAAKAARAAERAARAAAKKADGGKGGKGGRVLGTGAYVDQPHAGCSSQAASQPVAEKRAARYRETISQKTMQRAERVMTQRMFMVDRESVGTVDVPMERFKVLGSTGNVYTTTIGNVPRCDCPDFGFGNKPCKHIIFVFLKVLKLAMSDHAWYQGALLTDELRAIFAAAPPTPCATVSVSAQVRNEYLRATGGTVEPAEEAVGKRLASVGEDCPVCYEEMTEKDDTTGKLVYDESATGCGKALHAECFKMWAATASRKGDAVTCVWCRAPWPVPATSSKSGSSKYKSGYLNMAAVAGMSGVRDTSTYYGDGRPWGPRYDSDWL